jgi:lipopolysaccharide/colanic/teichoic acid biosynthesis glycosyltransferase
VTGAPSSRPAKWRFAVPQGLTGWWQISGRSDKPMHLNTDDDLYYVYKYSLWLDIQILIRTPFAVLTGRGAF